MLAPLKNLNFLNPSILITLLTPTTNPGGQIRHVSWHTTHQMNKKHNQVRKDPGHTQINTEANFVVQVVHMENYFAIAGQWQMVFLVGGGEDKSMQFQLGGLRHILVNHAYHDILILNN